MPMLWQANSANAGETTHCTYAEVLVYTWFKLDRTLTRLYVYLFTMVSRILLLCFIMDTPLW